jgi:anaerobic selenocysteine-containing dehydrogenase
MHPSDAKARKLTASRVRVFNDRGAVVPPLKITGAIAPGWLSERVLGCHQRDRSDHRAPVSADHKADLAHGACFNDTAVEVAAA